MTDIIYNAITRPIPSEPDKIDGYHLRKVAKDAKAKRIDDEDPNPNQQQPHHHQGDEQDNKEDSADEQALEQEQENNLKAEHSNNTDQQTTPKGKGQFKDDDGVEHLDIYI